MVIDQYTDEAQLIKSSFINTSRLYSAYDEESDNHLTIINGVYRQARHLDIALNCEVKWVPIDWFVRSHYAVYSIGHDKPA